MGLFGIKTKKDKQIEQLKIEVEWLKGQKIEPVVLVSDKRNIIHLSSACEVYDEVADKISQDYIKQILVKQLSNKLLDHMEVIRIRDYMMGVTRYKGIVNIVEENKKC